MTAYPAWVRPATTEYCVAAGCRRRPVDDEPEAAPTPRRAVRGTDLCEVHHDRFPRVLGDLVTLARELEAAQVRRPAPSAGGAVQTSGVSDVGSFWNPAASAVLNEIADWAGFLGRVVVREYQLPDPRSRTFTHKTVSWTPDGTRVEQAWDVTDVERVTHGFAGTEPPRTLLAIAAKHYGRWLTSYPALGPALLEDAITFRMQAVRALDITPVRRLRVAGYTCGHVIEDTEWGQLLCGAALSAILRPEDGNRPSQILCSTDPFGHPQLPRDQWMEFAAHARA